MLLDGSKQATKQREALAGLLTPGELGLGIIVATDNAATHTYITAKRKAAESVGIRVIIQDLGGQATKTAIVAACQSFNQDDSVTGYIVQLPLPAGVSQQTVFATVDPAKDADGLTPTNLGYLFTRQERIIPATPRGILSLLAGYEIPVAGKNITVVGKGLLTGLPLATLLSHRGATVTSCDRLTPNLAEHTRRADIIITAAGAPGLITADMVSTQAVVVDVGTTKTGGELKGDVEFVEVSAKVAAISPVPGGVGPMTVVSLLENVHELKNIGSTPS